MGQKLSRRQRKRVIESKKNSKIEIDTEMEILIEECTYTQR